MRCFSIIAAFAFAASVFAAPVDPPAVPSPPALPAIITQLTSQLQPLAAQLVEIVQVGNATVVALQPVTDEIQALIGIAVNDVKALIGLPVAQVLANAETIVPISDAAVLVANLLEVVIGSFGTILSVASTTETKVVVPFLLGIGAEVGQLLGAIATAVVGIVVYITPLVGDLVTTIVNLNLAEIMDILGLH